MNRQNIQGGRNVKIKQVVKMLSIGMAGILAISSCNMAGGMVYAEEVSQENVVEAVLPGVHAVLRLGRGTEQQEVNSRDQRSQNQ